jgi:hypothetical protein
MLPADGLPEMLIKLPRLGIASAMPLSSGNLLLALARFLRLEPCQNVRRPAIQLMRKSSSKRFHAQHDELAQRFSALT